MAHWGAFVISSTGLQHLNKVLAWNSKAVRTQTQARILGFASGQTSRGLLTLSQTPLNANARLRTHRFLAVLAKTRGGVERATRDVRLQFIKALNAEDRYCRNSFQKRILSTNVYFRNAIVVQSCLQRKQQDEV